jgi:hypothetical protein
MPRPRSPFDLTDAEWAVQAIRYVLRGVMR